MSPRFSFVLDQTKVTLSHGTFVSARTTREDRITFGFEDPAALADATVQLLDLPDAEVARMGAAGYAHALANHDVLVLADRVLSLVAL